MAHVVKLRVKDTTASTGTGTKVLARTSTLNFRTFDAVMANGDTCDAIVINRSANQWEHSSWTIAGVGSEPALTRLEFKESSTGAPVHFTEGTKDVLMLYPVAGKLDFTARTLKLAPNIIDGTPGTTSAFRFYDDGNGWIGGIGISSGAVDIRSGWHLNLWSGQTGNQRNTIRVNQNGLGIAVGAAVAAGIDPQAALHVVNRGGAPSAIITTGTSLAVRIGLVGAAAAVEGVDYTGLATYKPLFLNGEEVMIASSGVERMRVKWDGSVAIGATIAPARLSISLDGVADPNNYGKAFQITRGPSGGQQAAFIRNGAQVVSLGYLPGSSSFGFGLGQINDASFWPNYLAIGPTGNIGVNTATPNARLSFGTNIGLNGLYLYDDGNAGAVGFGISAHTLNIFANALSATSAAIAFGKYDKTTFTEWARFINGFMGLGTASPAHLLDVMGSTFGVTEKIARISNVGGSRYLQFGVLAYSGNQAPYIQSYHTNSDANPWNLLLNPNGGNAGIGTSTPADNLHVSSPSNGGRMFVGESGGSRRGLLLAATTSGELASGTPYARIEAFNYGAGLGLPLVFNPGGSPVGIGVVPEAGYKLDLSGSKVRFKNWGGGGSASEFYQDVGGRGVYRGVNYDGNYLHEYGYPTVAIRYSDFDIHIWRSSSGAERLLLNDWGLGVGRYPSFPLDVMCPSLVTVGYQVVANLGVYNATAGAAFTRMYIGQLSPNVMFLEVANKDNVKGDLVLQPYGGYVIVGGRMFSGVDIGQLSVQADYNGPLTMAMYNHNSIGAGSSCKFNMIIGGRRVERLVFHADRWIQEKGFGIDQYYNEFDTHYWRNNAGLNKMILHSNNVLWLGNTGGDPVTPGGGGYLYIVGGVLKYKGSSGTVTTLGAA